MRTIQSYHSDHHLKKQEVITFALASQRCSYHSNYYDYRTGNLLTLNSKGHNNSTGAYELLDKLVYTYPSHSSQLYTVEDQSTTVSQPLGLKPVNSEYSYNGAGALSYDMGKGLSLDYNVIQLPKSITGTGFLKLDYTYSGEKIRRKGDGAAGYSEVRYFQGLEVYDGLVQSFYHPEGRIRLTDVNTQSVEFTLLDHLGNSVVTFEDLNDNGEIAIEGDTDPLEIYQRHYYYPFGLEMQGVWTQDGTPKMPYRYNSKEFYVDVEANMLDYGARYLMPEIGRWNAVEPLGAKYAGVSPYSYCLNSPMSFVDPDGMDAILVVFSQYKVQTPIGKVGGLGHAGVLLIDNKTGVTKYYEYGRYDQEGKGLTRTVKVSNVVIGKDGRPTEESLNKVLGQISKQSGQGGDIEGAYIVSDRFDKMNEYAKSKIEENKNPDREPYSLTGNNCGIFAADVINQDPTVDQPSIVNPKPVNIVDEYQEEGNARVYYNAKEKKTTRGKGDEGDAKKKLKR